MINLVLIDCHDLGRHLGCYGQPTVTSPNLDALAAKGVRFANSFCTAPQCSPSRAALYTGRYGHANGMFGLAHEPFNWRLHADEVYLPRYLQQAGYATWLVGGQHVTDPGTDAIKQLGFDAVRTTRNARQIVAEVRAFLEQPHERPFFLNIGFYETHRDETGGFKDVPPDAEKGVQVPPYLPDTPEARREVAELQGTVKWLDAAVGDIFTSLQTLGYLQNTWLIFTTDHGIAMPRAKCTMYDPGIETALIMYAESLGLNGGRLINELISHVDLVPTLLEALGIPAPLNLHGQSYFALLQGKPHTPRDYVYASKTYHTAYEPQRAIRTDRHKLILNLEVDIINVPADIQHSAIYPQMIHELTQERPPVELYDLAADPQERHNLADDPAYAAVKQMLLAALHQWMHNTGDPLLNGPVASPYYFKALRLLRGEQA